MSSLEVSFSERNLNLHALEGYFVKRTKVLGEYFERFELMEDVIFIFREDEHKHESAAHPER